MNEVSTGWQCPCCRKVYAPSVKECSPCSPLAPATISPPSTVPDFMRPPTTGDRTVWINPFPNTCAAPIPAVLWNGPIHPDGSPAPIGSFKEVWKC